MSTATTPKPDITFAAALDRYFEVALYLLIVIGFAMVAATGQLDPASLLLVGFALLGRGYLLVKQRKIVLSETTTSRITLAYVLFYALDLFYLSGNFVTATVHLVLFSLVVKIFSVHRDRDHLFLAILAFLMVLAAAVLTVNSTFFVLFTAFILLAVVTFTLMEMKRAAAAATVKVRHFDWWAIRRMIFSISVAAPVLLLLILAGGAAIFFLLPRISAGYLSALSPSSAFTTGFSENVRLGQIGRIQQSNAVVMHIQIQNDPGGQFDLKWRGVSLSHFDGMGWSNPLPQYEAPRAADRSFLLSRGDPEWQALVADPRPTYFRQLHYRVLMEPIGTNVFFLAGKPQVLSGDYRMVAIDPGGGVYDADRFHPITVYQATSSLPVLAPDRLRRASGSYPPSVSLNYLQLPQRVDARLRTLARDITASKSNNYDRALAVEQYLLRNYGYTLEMPRVPPRDPLANFLFERRQGHCEYFASAMAVMLRTLDIPSRIVNGFRGGDFNDLTSSYVVRARNAHSWVEVYFPDAGWVPFDPTPAAAITGNPTWNRFMLYLDAASEFWREWVVNYDFSHQRLLEEQAGRSSRHVALNTTEWIQEHYQALLNFARRSQARIQRSPARWSGMTIVGVLLLLTLINAPLLLRAARNHRVAARPERAPQMAASIWYARMTRFVARRGWRKSPSHTPAEFVTLIEDSHLRASVERFTQHYEKARFGDSAADAQRLPELYEEITSRK